MIIVVMILHVIMCLILIAMVLLQTGKGASMGAAFGGGSNTLFGAAGPASFLNKLTTVAAVVFMVTSFTLAILSSRSTEASRVISAPVQQEETATEIPAAETTTVEPAVEAPAEEPITEEPVAEEPVEEPITEEPAEEPAVEVTPEASAEETAAAEPAAESTGEVPTEEPADEETATQTE